MTPDQSERIREVFADALDQPEAERAAFVSAACGSDPELHAAVERLLRAHAESAAFAPDLEPDPHEGTASQGTMIGRYRVRISSVKVASGLFTAPGNSNRFDGRWPSRSSSPAWTRGKWSPGLTPNDQRWP